ncbi:hypothetical protein DIPPA_27918 [Diplonema papillatum]|nr:hypothetical protein DIPPA_27918 [Diplonema papillatum]
MGAVTWHACLLLSLSLVCFCDGQIPPKVRPMFVGNMTATAASSDSSKVAAARAGKRPGAASFFLQKSCGGSFCNNRCTMQPYNFSTCYPSDSGTSVVATTCNPAGLLLYVFMDSERCIGTSVPIQQEVGMCELGQSGTSFINYCE